ncbi:MAG: hypothetical protein ACKOPM_12300 [Novosphingobium sp.]
MIATATLLRATCVLLGLWGLLHAAQWLVDLPNWRAGSALGWDLQGLRKGIKGRSALFAALVGERGLRLLAALLALVGLLLVVLPLGPLSPPLLAGALALAVLLGQRTIPDGADKMAMVVASGALLQALGFALENAALVLAGALWTGGQLTIAYFAAGASKVILADWRSGAAPRAALDSYMWGNRLSAWGVNLPGGAIALAWTVMVFEMLFPLALLLPTGGLIAVLTCFFLFHAAIALVMGLNTYPLAFLAAYPSAIWLGQWLRGAIGLG